MNELKRDDEIVRALRDYASDCDSDSEYCFQCTFACVCDKLDNNAPKIIADLIDNLTAQLASVTAERDMAKDAVNECLRVRTVVHCELCKKNEDPDYDCTESGCRPECKEFRL